MAIAETAKDQKGRMPKFLIAAILAIAAIAISHFVPTPAKIFLLAVDIYLFLALIFGFDIASIIISLI